MGGIKEMLSKEQMKSVVGGYGYGYTGDFCMIYTTSASGIPGTTGNSVYFSNGSAGANAYCVNVVTSSPSGTRCHYDCMADGWGV